MNELEGNTISSDLTGARQRIIVALDVDNEKDAIALVRELRGEVGLFKIGLELFTSVGPSIVSAVRNEGGDVFLDCKYMDIPATVAGASRAAARLRVRFFNVHCLGGSTMIAAAAEAVRNANCEAPRPQLLGVTVLTSLDQATISGELNIQTPLVDEVVHLATLGIEAGLDGVIASPLELPVLRKALPRSAIVITPGVRPVWAAGNDQKRIATPADAVRDGADFLVIGRPITKPPHGIGSPRDAAQRVAREIAGVVEVQK